MLSKIKSKSSSQTKQEMPQSTSSQGGRRREIPETSNFSSRTHVSFQSDKSETNRFSPRNPSQRDSKFNRTEEMDQGGWGELSPKKSTSHVSNSGWDEGEVTRRNLKSYENEDRAGWTMETPGRDVHAISSKSWGNEREDFGGSRSHDSIQRDSDRHSTKFEKDNGFPDRERRYEGDRTSGKYGMTASAKEEGFWDSFSGDDRTRRINPLRHKEWESESSPRKKSAINSFVPANESEPLSRVKF